MTLSPRRRRGSALVLVLVMTLSLAGLAISAVLLTSSSALVQRYYDKERDFRFAARAAVGLVRSRVQRDTTVTIPGDSAYRALTASTITDATGGTNTSIKVNAYAAYTGDTAGTYIPFLTILAQAYDTLGVRSVVRHDLRSEAFSRYALFFDTSSTAQIPLGQVVRGRVHANRNLALTATSPGPTFYDSVTAVGSVSGTATYNGGTPLTGVKRIKWPTTSTSDMTKLATLASAGGLSFAPVGGTSITRCSGTSVSGIYMDLAGRYSPSLTGCFMTGSGGFGYTGFFSWRYAVRGTRLRFRPVDVNNNGSYDASEGFFEVFDLAAGMDTSSLRADIPRTTSSPLNYFNIVVQNQCGLMVTIGGRREFFPVARFREGWVQSRIQLSTAPVISAADAASMGGVSGGNNPAPAAVDRILGYGNGYSRCFPAGSPYLMLTERYVSSGCAIDSTVGSSPYGWGNASGGCGAAQQYGGQDTTFTANAMRCKIRNSGQCSDPLIQLGSWRAFGGTNTAAPPATVIQAVEKPYLWPISAGYNAASRGVAYASASNPLFVSDTLRGFLTLYALGDVVLINDVVYDADPLASGNQCRNFLGIISGGEIAVADNAMNRPRPTPDGTYRFLGTPNFTLHGIMMSLTSTVGVEAPSGSEATSPSQACNGTNTSGGCLNHTGGVIAKSYALTSSAAGRGLIENRTRDPCQAQATNRRPPFFPLTGKYVDYKQYDVDPRQASTWSMVKTYLARLRGNNRAVP